MRRVQPQHLVPLVSTAQQQIAEAEARNVGEQGSTGIDRQLAAMGPLSANTHEQLKRAFERVEGGGPLHRRLIGGATFKRA